MQPTTNLNNNADLRDKLISYLQDVYALEDHLVEILGQHAADAEGVPLVHQKIQQHIEETKQHRERIKTCLAAYEKSPNGMKSALSGLMGKLQGAFAGARHDVLAMNSRDEYVAENFEIASYGMLIATAQAFGDTTTVQACQLNLADEVTMAKWLEGHTAEAALVSLQMDGIAIPQATIQQIQATENTQMEQLWQQATRMAKADATPIMMGMANGSTNVSDATLYNAGFPPPMSMPGVPGGMIPPTLSPDADEDGLSNP